MLSVIGMPRVVRASPKDETGLMAAIFFDYVSLDNQLHFADIFFLKGAHSSQKICDRMFHQVSLAGLGIPPSFRANAMHDLQKILTRLVMRPLAPGHGYSRLH